MLGQMPPEFRSFSTEILTEKPQLPKVDLKSLTLVSAYLRRVAAPHLWTSIVVYSPDEENPDEIDFTEFPHLEDLELDLIEFSFYSDYYARMAEDGVDDDDDLMLGFLTGHILELPDSLFLNLSRLSLSQVEVGPGMVNLFNFDVLRSLTLRKCPGWARFIDSIHEAELLLRLKTLEVQDYDSDNGATRTLYLLCLLEISIGLEELYVNIDEWPGALLFLEEISKDQPTLKRFAQYPTVKDDPKLGKSELLATMERRDLPNPLGSLSLEAYSLTCNPRFISFLDQKQTLQSFSTRHTLKVVHIRPVRGMMEDSYLHPLVAGNSRQSSRSDNYSGNSSTKATHDDTWASLPLGLRYEFRPVAKWAFGRHGLASLELIVFGDFAHDGRNGWHNFMLCRSSGGSGNFRCLAKESYEWRAVVEEYRSFLESCPSERLLEMG
ncbi:hypothetical protein FDECE_8980 [Fusarium decemcellulare]|nr:hypothetical protein FDECE_8980 [Fusarium decemcellulare]